MIDFAHATHQGFLQDKTTHVGPDHGYIFGLQNLIHMFEELKITAEPVPAMNILSALKLDLRSAKFDDVSLA